MWQDYTMESEKPLGDDDDKNGGNPGDNLTQIM